MDHALRGQHRRTSRLLGFWFGEQEREINAGRAKLALGVLGRVLRTEGDGGGCGFAISRAFDSGGGGGRIAGVEVGEKGGSGTGLVHSFLRVRSSSSILGVNQERRGCANTQLWLILLGHAIVGVDRGERYEAGALHETGPPCAPLLAAGIISGRCILLNRGLSGTQDLLSLGGSVVSFFRTEVFLVVVEVVDINIGGPQWEMEGLWISGHGGTM